MKPDPRRKSVPADRPSDEDQLLAAEDRAAISRPSRQSEPRHVHNRKTLQLCRQVSETLNGLLSGESGDPVLQSLSVVSVTPAPNASQLLVLVESLDHPARTSEADVLAHLSQAAGWLRTEMAAAITRRKAPQLVFQIQPADLRHNTVLREEDQP